MDDAWRWKNSETPVSVWFDSRLEVSVASPIGAAPKPTTLRRECEALSRCMEMEMAVVLIVDDSPTVRQQVKLALTPAGFDVIEAPDGAAGLELIQNRSDISLVISDVNMPNMNGIEMVTEVSTRKLRPELPIVMLTTEGDPGLMRKAKEAGVAGWIIKPFQSPMLVAAAKKLAKA